ncbi:RrF2 family transcriptional regulator [Leifsonia sp. Root112D2]|uniref:RrF2 family transcriptional regulator n=1 Tax=Leifsonia sp. Root112D2 TaxID=1736426 RepID=UPI00070127E2|nr:Rrf2 family transcriptional regulator [Leifsonia sp. Root112D2]KQV07012.1 hypothetical protein ASC63_06630 [Leifsonia sp. Root112D2]
MQVTAKADYALRALAELAATPSGVATRAQLAEAQQVPSKFLEAILLDLKRAGLLTAQRGAAGGYALAIAADQISLADGMRAVEGPLAGVRGLPPEDTEYRGAAAPLREVWVAVRAGIRAVLEATTIADLVSGSLPKSVRELLEPDDVWQRR